MTSRSKVREIAENVAVSMLAVVFTVLALEFVVFRYVLIPDDLLPNVTINGVVRYEPGTNATFRHPDNTATKITINKQGWNSTKPDYAATKVDGRQRIAVIGDSYVHGAFVDVEDGFPEILEEKLRSSGQDVEVYRFGMDGAPLSQYLNVLRYVLASYSPDIVVIPLIHNDFDESYRFLKTRYASAFMKLTTDDNGGVVEVPPSNFEPGLADRLRQFATFRYLYYETGLYLSAKGFVSRFFWGGEEEWQPEFISSAVDIRKIADHEKNRMFARYVLNEMKAQEEQHGFKLFVVMDGVRDAINSGRPSAEFEVSRLNELAADLTRELQIPFRDLHQAFEQDYAASAIPLEFPYDWHWSKRANEIVAREIADLIAPALKPSAASAQLRAPVAHPRETGG